MTAHQMLAKVRNLPPISMAALELAGLLDGAETNNEELVAVLKRDSVLTAKLLRASKDAWSSVRGPWATVRFSQTQRRLAL